MAKQTTSLRVLRGILCGTGAAVIGVYAGFCVYYHGHYFPHTTIGANGLMSAKFCPVNP